MTFQTTLPWRIFINREIVSSPWKCPPRGSRGRICFFFLQFVGFGGIKGYMKYRTFSSLHGYSEVKSSVGFNNNFG